MPRMSKKRKQEWALFLNERNRITYNELCRKCSNDCKQSFRCIVVLCLKYLSKRRTKNNDENGNEMNVNVPLEIIKASEIEPKEVKWLWYPYIPFGKVTLLQGDPGDGKSKLMLSIAALLSKGEPLPFTEEETEPMTVIYQTTEDDADDTVVPRFNSAGGNGENLIFIKEDEKSLSFGDNRIAEAIERYHAKLLILDPMSSYIGENCSMNNANETRAEFNHLIAVAKIQAVPS